MISGVLTTRPGEPAYLWSGAGEMHYANDFSGYAAPPGWTVGFPGDASDWTLTQWAVAVTPPPDCEPGIYAVGWRSNLKPGEPEQVRVIRVEEPPGPTTTVSTVAGLREVLAAGASHVVLTPGIYEVDEPLLLGPGSAPVTVRGAYVGSVVLKKTGTEPGNHNSLFVLSGQNRSVTLEDLTLVGRGITVSYVALAWPRLNGRFTVRGCRLWDIQVGEMSDVAEVVEGNAFERAGCGPFHHNAVVRNNDFTGFTPTGGHLLFSSGSSGALVLDNTISHASRGIVLQGPCSNCVVLNNRVFDVIGGEPNSGEGVLLENTGPGVCTDNVLYANRVRGAATGISLYGGRYQNTMIQGNVVEGAEVTLGFYSLQGPITGNTVSNLGGDGRVEVIGASGNNLNNIKILLPARHFGNRDSNPTFPPGLPFRDTGSGNVWQLIRVVDADGERLVTV